MEKMKKMEKNKGKVCTQKSGAKKTQARPVRKAKRTTKKASQKNERLQLRPGIRKIDVSAVRRMITWSIDECERQLMNLRSTLEVIDGLTANDTKEIKKIEIVNGEDDNG